MRGFPASPRGEGGSPSSSVPQLSVGTLLAAWRGSGPPHATRWGPRRWGLRGCSKNKFHTIAHSRHRTYPEAERDASSLRLQGLGGAGGSPPLSSSHDCARSRVCGTPARRVPPAAQLCTKAAWHCLAFRTRPAPLPLFPSGGEGLALSHPGPPLLLLPPPRSQAGQPGGTERPAPSSAAVAAAARTVTFAAFAAIYIHTIGFHS